MTQYYGNGITLEVKGRSVYLPQEVINELHRQENIQWGKDILANYTEMIEKDFEKITDDEFEVLAILIENKMMENNGDIELEAIQELFEIEL